MADMKQAYIDAVNKYMQAVKDATPEDREKALQRGESVAEKLLDEVTRLDYSPIYNAGWKYDELDATEAPMYRQWVEDWGLEPPTGEPPEQRFDPAENY